MFLPFMGPVPREKRALERFWDKPSILQDILASDTISHNNRISSESSRVPREARFLRFWVKKWLQNDRLFF